MATSGGNGAGMGADLAWGDLVGREGSFIDSHRRHRLALRECRVRMGELRLLQRASNNKFRMPSEGCR